MGKTIAIMQSNYIPWRGYFDMINRVDEFIIYDCCQYTKNDWRNRNIIKTPRGTQWLTIPVYHHLSQKINETVISDKLWNVKHWITIEQFYRNASYFKRYKNFFNVMYATATYNFLSEINLHFIKGICGLLNITTPLIDSSELHITGDKTEKIVNICRQRGANRYLSGPAAKDYIDMNLMKGIEVEWMSYDYDEYKQLYPPFDQKVSIIDYIFNCGVYERQPV